MKLRFHLMIWMLVPFAFAASGQAAASQAQNTPQKVTVCELLTDTAKWNRKLVQVTGLASHGFEDSGFGDPTCSGNRYGGLWMTYGGKKITQTTSTANEIGPPRKSTLNVDGVSVPLVDDAVFRRFDSLLHASNANSALVHATVIARFFAASRTADSVSGYGHLGCCSLFAIQQVLSVDEAPGTNLDRSDTPDQPKSYPFCGLMRDQPNLFEQQQAAERNASFPEAQQAATTFLQSVTRTPDATDITLKPISTSIARILYEAHIRDSKALYQVEVSRPLWLSYYAKEPDKVAWLVIAGYGIGEESMASCRGGTTSLLKE